VLGSNNAKILSSEVKSENITSASLQIKSILLGEISGARDKRKE
jgi:hypothetical protein